MLSGVPNFSYVFGYTNAAWTLRVGPLAEHFCRLLRYMDAHGFDTERAQQAPVLNELAGIGGKRPRGHRKEAMQLFSWRRLYVTFG
jgi:cation diffusion facilitator CzcD-associated flavoprotein CzcO